MIHQVSIDYSTTVTFYRINLVTLGVITDRSLLKSKGEYFK